MIHFSRTTFTYLLWIAASAGLSLIHPGDAVGLVLVVALQFYLPGVLLARALGCLHTPHPISRFAWVLVCAFGLTITLAMFARWIGIPVPLYVLLLHGVMVGLAWVRPPTQHSTDAERWRFRWADAPLYGLVVACCLITLIVGLQRGGFRFNGFEDQTVFISLADWLANSPDDPHLLDRRIGVLVGDTRWQTDGWTYTHAAWVWSSGYPAADLIWHALTPLFVWATPLAIFALVYEATRRETAAAFGSAALVIVGLLTLDSLVYYPTTLAFGQFSLFQVNSLRTISTALVTPLALMTVLAYLRGGSWRLTVIIVLIGLALASLHPRQIVIFLYSAGGIAFIWWLAQPTRARLTRAGMLLILLVSLLVLPALQRIQRPVVASETVQVDAPADDEDSTDPRGEYLILENLPLLRTSFIVSPTTVFYHPFVAVVIVLGLAAGIAWRRSLAAQVAFASTVLTLLLLFTPGLTPIFTRFVSSVLAPGVIFGLPVALILGCAVDFVLRGRLLRTIGAALLLGVMLALLIEPFPIPASARDQIRASNLLQSTRDIRPWDQALLAALAEALPDDRRSIILSPEPGANFIIESLPRTFITGGRASRNLAAEGSRRFFSQTPPAVPWFDSVDLAFLRQWGVTHIVVEMDDTRLAQLSMQPERFDRLGSAAGFVLFRVAGSLEPDAVDDLFVQMNTLYAAQGINRWSKQGFLLTNPGTQTGWRAIAEQWAALPDSDRARLGSAFTQLMIGQNRADVALWDELRADYPTVPLLYEAAAALHAATNRPAESAAVLVEALESDDAGVRVLAAKTLLTDDFLYLLDDDEQLARALAVAAEDDMIWRQLAEFDSDDDLRRRIVLLMSRQQWATAEQWSQRLPEAEVDPRDLVTRAALRLVQGDRTGARALLESVADVDFYAANRHLHPDRWANNIALAALAQFDTPTASDAPSLSLLADAAHPYVMQPRLVYNEDDSLTVSAIFGNLHSAPYPVESWRVLVTSPDATTFYAEHNIEAVFAGSLLTRAVIPLDIDAAVPPLTPARVFVEPRYDNRVTFGQVALDAVLNRPPAADLSAAAEAVGAQFGDTISLTHAAVEMAADALVVSLYWRAAASPSENYQVFIHVVDSDGNIVVQRDSAPVDGRYPTTSWRVDTLIEDVHRLSLAAALPAGEYRIVVGLYRLPGGERLSVTGEAASTAPDSLSLYTFTQD